MTITDATVARGRWVNSVFICPQTWQRCAGKHGNFTCEKFGCTEALARMAPLSTEIEQLKIENIKLYEKIEALQNQIVQVCGEAGDEILRLRRMPSEEDVAHLIREKFMLWELPNTNYLQAELTAGVLALLQRGEK